MKRILFALAIVLGLALGAVAQVTYAPLQVNKTTDALPGGTAFWTANSNGLMSIVGSALSASTVLVVSPTGNDATASAGNAALPFATIQAAASNAVNYSVIKVLPGTYAITPTYDNISTTYTPTAPIKFRNLTNVALIGDGVTITGNGLGCYISGVNVDGLLIKGLHFKLTKPSDGSGMTNQYIGTITGFGTNKNWQIDGVTINGALNQGITFARMQDGLDVHDSRFLNIGSTNVSYVTNAVRPPYVDGTAISGLGGNTRVVNNYFDGNYRDVEWDDFGGNTAKWSGLTIANNIFSNTLHCSILISSPNTTYSTASLRRVSITDNIMHGSTNWNSAYWSIDTRWDQSAGVQAHSGINVNHGDLVVIARNIIDNVYNFPIWVQGGPMDGLMIEHNQIYGLGTAFPAGAGTNNSANMGIMLTCTSNTLRPDIVRNVSIRGNHIYNTISDAIQLSGGNVVCSDNYFFNCGGETGVTHYDVICNTQGSGNWLVNWWFDNNKSFSSKTAAAAPFLLGGGSSGVCENGHIGAGNLALGNANSAGVADTPYNIGNIKTKVWFDRRQGQATLSGGKATVSTVAVKSTSLIKLTSLATGANAGWVVATNISAGTSFDIQSSNTSDANKVAWEISDETKP